MPAPVRLLAGESSPTSASTQRGSFHTLPGVLQAYILVSTAVGAGIMAVLARKAPQEHFESPWLFVAVLITSVVLSATKVRLPLMPSGATVSLSYCTNFAALALFGPFAATFIIAFSVWSQCVVNAPRGMATYRTIYSIANIVVATAIAQAAANVAGGLSVGDSWVPLMAPTLAGATAFFFCNTVMLAIAVALESKRSAATLWGEQFLWSAPACFVGAVAGTSAAYLIKTQNSFGAFVAIPIVLFYWGYRTYLGFIERQEAMHLATVEALARAIGARDQTLESSRAVSDTHVRRVQRLAVLLAHRVGMTTDEVKGVEVAALLHDIGKLAVPEHILNKPGSLTEEEKKLVRQHPTVGAEIIGAVDFGYPVAPLIASHHERWNGQGYPNGLKGEEIPLGSRILGIVDYFDALIADRPYHKAWSEAEAREILRSEAGQVLDPKLVKMFLDILEEESPLGEVPSTPRATSAQANLSGHARDAAPAIETVIENIARANTEMVALYQLTEELGSRIELKDTIGILISRLSSLIPASAWALFLCDETEGASRCAHAQGLDSDRLQLLVIPEGAGVVGYLARQGKTIRNANPAGDFKAAGALEHGSSLRSMIACPLRRKTRTVGVLVAYHVEPGHFTEGHESTLEKVALKVAAVVDDAQTFEKVRTESLTDPLTGLHNSRALIDHIEREISSADDSNTERALLVIDVDRFKLINDRFGHPAGDRALQFIARAIRGSVRVDDFCARQGGDEFIVVLECDALHALERAIELQHAVSGIPFEPEPGVAVTLSISVGHAMYPSEGRSLDALIRQADHRMYQDKSGRKRRETRGFPVPAGLER